MLLHNYNTQDLTGSLYASKEYPAKITASEMSNCWELDEGCHCSDPSDFGNVTGALSTSLALECKTLSDVAFWCMSASECPGFCWRRLWNRNASLHDRIVSTDDRWKRLHKAIIAETEKWCKDSALEIHSTQLFFKMLKVCDAMDYDFLKDTSWIDKWDQIARCRHRRYIFEGRLFGRSGRILQHFVPPFLPYPPKGFSSTSFFCPLVNFISKNISTFWWCHILRIFF